MGHKAAETTQSINSAFGPETVNGPTVQWWFRKIYKGDGGLGDEEHSGRPLEVGKNQLRGSSKLVLLKLHEKLPKNSVSTILWSFDIWIKLERWKNSISGCLMSWPWIKKWPCHFEVSSSLILHNTNKRVLNCIVTYYKKWILYDNRQQPAQWLE